MGRRPVKKVRTVRGNTEDAAVLAGGPAGRERLIFPAVLPILTI